MNGTPADSQYPPDMADDRSQLVLDLKGVDKVYGRGRRAVHALRGIDMRVGKGEIFGLLGPNGAGKSTLVKILMTVIAPTACGGTFLGRAVGDKAALARVGYLPEHHKFPDYLTGAQVLDFYAALHGVPRAERRKRAGHLLDLVGMARWGSTKVRGYSKGMRQRIGIAQALMNNPDVVLLDEPTDGVDPVGRRDIRNVLTEIRSQGRTVFLNSHLLSELEMVCDRVAILVQGRVVSQGTIKELTQDQERYEIELGLPATDGADRDAYRLLTGSEPPPSASAPPMPTPSAAHSAGLRAVLHTGLAAEFDRHIVRLRTSDAAAVQPVIDALRARSVTIRSVRAVRPSLEDLFMQAVTDPVNGRALAPGAAPG
ncbi:MAG: ATP-binding cassette domain-containing protein [Phycisphaerales bacterium]|nr:ATP-binding cassette domain-containing protein [Phycisphaerales bacterium]